MLSDRLNTMDMLDRHHCERENDDLILCLGGHRETRQHLFFTRPFNVRCWQHLGIDWHTNLNFFQMIVLARLSFGQKGFLEIFFVASWHIWKQRNGLIFQNVPPSFQAWRALFKKKKNLLHMCRMKDTIKQIVFDRSQFL